MLSLTSERVLIAVALGSLERRRSTSTRLYAGGAQSCPTLCNPMNRSMPGLTIQHQLPEFTETHVHRVSDAIQPSHPLSSPSPPAPNPSQDQPRLSAGRRESGSQGPWLGEAAPQPEGNSVCAQQASQGASERRGILWRPLPCVCVCVLVTQLHPTL